MSVDTESPVPGPWPEGPLASHQLQVRAGERGGAIAEAVSPATDLTDVAGFGFTAKVTTCADLAHS